MIVALMPSLSNPQQYMSEINNNHYFVSSYNSSTCALTVEQHS